MGLTVWFFQPSRAIHPNGRTKNWRLKWAAVKQFRALVGVLARAEAIEHLGRPPQWQQATARITIYYGPRQKRMDDDNLIAWLKPAFDGLQDAGIVANDRQLTHLPPVHARDKDRPRIEIQVNEA